MRRIALVFLLLTFVTGGLSAHAQQRRSSRRSASNRPEIMNPRLTGTYRLDTTRSDDARAIADRATINLPHGQRERVQDNVMGRLEAPDMLAVEQNGRNVSIASSRAARITFDADGPERSETMGNGRALRTRATLNFETIQLRNGRTYSFAGLINSVRTSITEHGNNTERNSWNGPASQQYTDVKTRCRGNDVENS
jgi:hypothetical protein